MARPAGRSADRGGGGTDGRHRATARVDFAGHRARQNRRDRQQSPARGARRGNFQTGRGEESPGFLRGGGGRRHPDHQGGARGLCGESLPAYPRHHQRHEQLHPHAHERKRTGFRGGLGRGAGGGLRGSRPDARRQRLGCRPQSGHSGFARLRLLGAEPGRSGRGHRAHRTGGYPFCRATRLHAQAARLHRRGGGWRGRGQRAAGPRPERQYSCLGARRLQCHRRAW